MSGISIDVDSKIYRSINSIGLDTQKSLLEITDKWINYINFEKMSDTQLQKLTEKTKNDLNQLSEFRLCLEDVLIYLYNNHVAKPLKLKKHEIKNTENRRYITEDGIVDNRHF